MCVAYPFYIWYAMSVMSELSLAAWSVVLLVIWHPDDPIFNVVRNPGTPCSRQASLREIPGCQTTTLDANAILTPMPCKAAATAAAHEEFALRPSLQLPITTVTKPYASEAFPRGTCSTADDIQTSNTPMIQLTLQSLLPLLSCSEDLLDQNTLSITTCHC